jgi:hypothetical protein
MRAHYQPTEEWFLRYGETVNSAFDVFHNIVDESYQLYETVKQIPFVGDLIANTLEGYLGKQISGPTQNTETTTKWQIPDKQQAMNLVSHAQNATMAGFAQYAADQTGGNAQNLYAKMSRTPKRYEREPSLFRQALYGFVQTANEIFGYTEKQPHPT